MEDMTLDQAIAILESFEFYMCGSVRRHPEEEQYLRAIEVIKHHREKLSTT